MSHKVTGQAHGRIKAIDRDLHRIRVTGLGLHQIRATDKDLHQRDEGLHRIGEGLHLPVILKDKGLHLSKDHL